MDRQRGYLPLTLSPLDAGGIRRQFDTTFCPSSRTAVGYSNLSVSSRRLPIPFGDQFRRLTSVTKNACAVLLLVLPFAGASEGGLTPIESRKLSVAAMPKKEVQKRGATIDLDRQQSGCAIYHAYGLTSEPPFATLTIGWWSVDLRTAEVWDELDSKRVTNGETAAIQRTVRRRLG